ncbi:MAG: hypothetical protein ABJP92_08440, partial [Flavobacteriaceae bacterium]
MNGYTGQLVTPKSTIFNIGNTLWNLYTGQLVIPKGIIPNTGNVIGIATISDCIGYFYSCIISCIARGRYLT